MVQLSMYPNPVYHISFFHLPISLSKIQEEFSYLPRAAVAKFIELCEVCSQHRPRKSTTSMVFMNKSSVCDMAAAGGSNESFDTNYETSDTSYETFDSPTFDMDFPHSS